MGPNFLLIQRAGGCLPILGSEIKIILRSTRDNQRHTAGCKHDEQSAALDWLLHLRDYSYVRMKSENSQVFMLGIYEI